MLKVPVDVGGGGFGGGVIVDAAFADHVAHVGQEGPRSPSRTRPTGRTPSSMSWHEHPVADRRPGLHLDARQEGAQIVVVWVNALSV